MFHFNSIPLKPTFHHFVTPLMHELYISVSGCSEG